MSGVETEVHEATNGAGDPGAAAGSAGGSLLEQVRQRLQETQDQADTLDMRLPRKEPKLVARYRVTDPDEIEGEDRLSSNVSMLSKACLGLFVDVGDGNLVPLEEDGEAVTYATAAQVLGFEAASAREAILHLFKHNEIAFFTHSDRVITWMQDTSQEVEGEVLGESSA